MSSLGGIPRTAVHHAHQMWGSGKLGMKGAMSHGGITLLSVAYGKTP